MPCPLCNYSANGVLAGVEHMKEFHPHVIETLQRKNNEDHNADENNAEGTDGEGSSSDSQDKTSFVKKKHKCKTCSASFAKPSDLVRHIRVHTVPPPAKTPAAKSKTLFPVKRLMPSAICHQPSLPAPEVPPPAKTPAAKSKTLFPVKRLMPSAVCKENTEVTQSKQFEETVAEISKLPPTAIKRSEGSAFGPVAKATQKAHLPDVEFFITARRISHNEYSVSFSKSKPKSIRSKVDTTVSLTASLLLDSASKNASIHLTLSDSQILSVSCLGLVKAMQSCNSVVMRARPVDPSCPSTVELLPPAEAVEFVRRCDVCEVDLHSKEASDAHFASEDHETAQVCSSDVFFKFS
ncbi:unnamed protein product [Strongylus vulgaris]|uniref:C2H2-type domain-containing protein n=1 Tax=Strongylus vulgaris TaxID=40348 RepID=A0A3P7JB79_STRVU|nr:unnamed protein product [Strongylus vulgaris]